MSVPAKLASNPLQDDELSDVTKREIIFWANKLKVTPSQLFSLTKEELDTLLESVIYGENNAQREKQAERWERLNRMKQKLIEGNEKDRLKGGLDLLELLCNAAQDIETYLCQQARQESYDNDDTDYAESSGDDDSRYRPSCPRGHPIVTSTPNACGPAAASTQNSCGPTATSTPYGTLNNCMIQSTTYDVPQQNATYDVSQQNATYNVSPQNATYNVSPQNATYNVPQDNTYCVQPGANATYNIPPSPMPADASAFRPYMESTPYEIRSPHEGAARRCPNITYVPGPYSLPPLNSPVTVEGSSHGFSCLSSSSGASRSRGSQPSPGRYQTRTIAQNSGAAYGSQDGAVGGMQICPAPPPNSPGAWAPQAVNFIGDSDSNRNSAFRNYTDYAITYGPCGSEETANSISVESFDGVSGKVTASSRTFSLPPACSPTDALGMSRISPPVLASGAGPRASPSPGAARARSPQNLSNTSPPSMASGCQRSPQRTPLSGVSPPSLASGASGGRECSPPPQQQQGRNPHLSAAVRATTPMRQRPNRPYRPRRLC